MGPQSQADLGFRLFAVAVGDIGAELRREFTVIGGAVYVAVEIDAPVDRPTEAC